MMLVNDNRGRGNSTEDQNVLNNAPILRAPEPVRYNDLTRPDST